MEQSKRVTSTDDAWNTGSETFPWDIHVHTHALGWDGVHLLDEFSHVGWTPAVLLASELRQLFGTSKGKVFYDQEPPGGESSTIECGVYYHATTCSYTTEVAQWRAPSCSRPQSTARSRQWRRRR